MVLLRQKVNVSGGDNANQLASHLAGFCYRDSRETVANLGLKHVAHCVLGAHHHWVCDETLLKFLAGRVLRRIHKYSRALVQQCQTYRLRSKLRSQVYSNQPA